MALSEQEQRLLDQMEAALEAEDPKFVSALRGPRHHWHRPRLALSFVLFALGVAALVVGMDVHPAVSISGFVVMLFAAVSAISAWTIPGDGDDHAAAGQRHPSQAERDFLKRSEDRRRRGEDDAL
jgi:hypothetical protein